MRIKQITIVASILMLTAPVFAQKKKTVKHAQKTVKTQTVKTQTVKKKTVAHVASHYNGYQTAIGLKALWGIGLTGKFFMKQNTAIETIVHYDGLDGTGTALNLTALYEYHGNTGLRRLRWYLGGGVSVGYTKLKDLPELDGMNESEPNKGTLSYGLDAVAGLEYKFNKLPIAVSVDWQPSYTLNSGGGFGSKGGGFGVKYTF